MSIGQKWNVLGLAAVAGLVTAPAVQAQEGPAPVNTGKVSWTVGVDAVTQYWFRGIAQENQGLILQPYFDVTFGLIGEGDITLDAYVGTWNSFHRDNSADDDLWYEADFFAGVAIGLPYGLALDVSYINLYNPDGSQSFAEEIDVAVAYDDSELMDSLGVPFVLNPYALVAFEFSGGSDAGDDEGTYLELGVEPSFALTNSEDYPVTLAIPVTAGFSLDNYYEEAVDGDDEFFGFFDIGAVVSVPLAFIPADYGAWEASAGVHWILLGDSTEELAGPDGLNVTSDDDNFVYATFGVSMSY